MTLKDPGKASRHDTWKRPKTKQTRDKHRTERIAAAKEAMRHDRDNLRK